ncbi:MAG: hypothetical protein AUK34_01520 [Ignavibacteria bacterium CG2_30_36_16]|nr:MAG: hypothetical protein AUK34_01520 [Ignavibacteria bacterium CG2_30_36_16]
MKLKKLHLILFGVLIFSTAIISFSCSCSACSQQEELEVPADILKKANGFIISKTGAEFFDKYISPDFVLTKKAGSVYEMAYCFIMPEKTFVDEVIRFTVDSTGSVVKNRGVTGIPDCINNPSLCAFNINEDDARNIAKEYKLESGVIDWKVGFLWDEKLNQYVWHVLSTLYESEGSNGYIGNGKELIIDPNTGLVLKENIWKIR